MTIRRELRASFGMNSSSPAWQEEHDARSFFRLRMVCFSIGTSDPYPRGYSTKPMGKTQLSRLFAAGQSKGVFLHE
jgi:hypothetical protein